MMLLYDYVAQNGRNPISDWSRQLTKPDRARLDLKLNALSQMDYNLAIGTKLLQGPIYKHIYKLKIHGSVMLRPLLCRGPIDNVKEYTLLAGATEVNFKLVPKDSPKVATDHRTEIVANPSRRCAHVRIL